MPYPLFLSAVAAGFPSPADDHIDRQLDLNAYLIRHPAATFFVRVRGRSMEGAGIFEGDLLVVDRALTPRHGDIVIAAVCGEVLVKYFERHGAQVRLTAAHPGYAPLTLTDAHEAVLWGVVRHTIRTFR